MGRELDVNVATTLGWRKTNEFRKARFGPGYSYWENQHGEVECLPDWKGDIAAAWTLVEFMAERDDAWQLYLREHAGPEWEAGFIVPISHEGFNYMQVYQMAPTAQEAICRAFLKTMEMFGG